MDHVGWSLRFRPPRFPDRAEREGPFSGESGRRPPVGATPGGGWPCDSRARTVVIIKKLVLDGFDASVRRAQRRWSPALISGRA